MNKPHNVDHVCKNMTMEAVFRAFICNNENAQILTLTLLSKRSSYKV